MARACPGEMPGSCRCSATADGPGPSTLIVDRLLVGFISIRMTADGRRDGESGGQDPTHCRPPDLEIGRPRAALEFRRPRSFSGIGLIRRGVALRLRQRSVAILTAQQHQQAAQAVVRQAAGVGDQRRLKGQSRKLRLASQLGCPPSALRQGHVESHARSQCVRRVPRRSAAPSHSPLTNIGSASRPKNNATPSSAASRNSAKMLRESSSFMTVPLDGPSQGLRRLGQ
jgi:hypothetical protein